MLSMAEYLGCILLVEESKLHLSSVYEEHDEIKSRILRERSADYSYILNSGIANSLMLFYNDSAVSGYLDTVRGVAQRAEIQR